MEINALNCPVCKSKAKIVKELLDKFSPIVFAPDYYFYCCCPNCKYIEYGYDSTVNKTEEIARNNAVEEWNENVRKFLNTYNKGHEGE